MPHRIADKDAETVMGNTSSQLAPQASGTEVGSQQGKSKDIKKRKRQEPNGSRDPGSDETSAHNPMFMNGSRPATPESLHDYAAASAQLLAESSSAPDFLIPTSPEDSDVPTNGHISLQRKPDERKRKGRSSALEPSLDAGNLQPGSKQFGSEVSPKLGREIGFDGTAEDGPDLSQHSFSLDDIDENEEGLTSLFQEYETQFSQPGSSTADATGHYGNSLLPLDQDFLDPTLAHEPVSSKRRGKRKRRLGSDVFNIGAEQELTNGTGQHAFDIDFDAFDEIFAHEGMQLANPFNEKSDHDLPNGIEPPQEGLSDQVDEEVLPTLDIGSAQKSQQVGGLPRMLSVHRPKKRRRMEVPNSLENQVPAYVSPYAPNEGQQDRVLPGLEDLQARLSSEIPFSHLPHLSNRVHGSPANQQLRQTPPAPLEKPSKPRGNKKQRGGKKGKDYNPPLQEMSEKGGMFTDAEIGVLDAFRDRYCEENNESHWRFNDLIQSNIRGQPEVGRLYMAVHDEVPYRTRQSVIRFCRRHFHNFTARGSWTEAEDALLRDAIAKKGTAWKAVGEMIYRFPEDCRDRYRNYLVNAEKRNTDTWSHEEIRNLVKAVDFCMRLLRQQRVQAREEKFAGHDIPESESEPDQNVQDMKLINWQVVSDRMGGTRSRLQCSGKWGYLKNEDREKYLREIRRLEKGLKPDIEEAISGSWRLKRAVKKLKNMKAGDKYEFLEAFANCGAATEKDIRWMSLGSKEFRQHWSAMDFKGALELFKRGIPGSDKMDYQEVVNRVLTRLMAEDPDALDDRWDPDADGDINKIRKYPSRRELREQRLLVQQPSAKSSKFKSTEFVDSDEEEEEVEEDQSIDHEAEKDANDDNEERLFLPSIADSAEEEVNGQASSEIGVSGGERDDERSSKHPSAATTADTEEVDNASSDSDTGELSTPTPRSKVDETSGDDSDDSLFNDGSVEEELVDQLQQLREN